MASKEDRTVVPWGLALGIYSNIGAGLKNKKKMDPETQQKLKQYSGVKEKGNCFTNLTVLIRFTCRTVTSTWPFQQLQQASISRWRKQARHKLCLKRKIEVLSSSSESLKGPAIYASGLSLRFSLCGFDQLAILITRHNKVSTEVSWSLKRVIGNTVVSPPKFFSVSLEITVLTKVSSEMAQLLRVDIGWNLKKNSENFLKSQLRL